MTRADFKLTLYRFLKQCPRTSVPDSTHQRLSHLPAPSPTYSEADVQQIHKSVDTIIFDEDTINFLMGGVSAVRSFVLAHPPTLLTRVP